MPLWGRFSDKQGNLISLKITGILIPLIPLLWLFSSAPRYLILVEAFGGFVWTGFDLASVNFVYDAVSQQRMGLCFAHFGVLNGLGTCATLGLFLRPIVVLDPSPFFLYLFNLGSIPAGCLRDNVAPDKRSEESGTG